jgi:hypothetical protein
LAWFTLGKAPRACRAKRSTGNNKKEHFFVSGDILNNDESITLFLHNEILLYALLVYKGNIQKLWGKISYAK